MSRIGIYAGTFDPVHSGHIAFALQSIAAARLDRIYFLPERRPRGKKQVEHLGHRYAMLQRALKPHPQCEAMELVDVSFTVQRTLPFLQKQFPDAELVFLFGSDVIEGLAAWPNVEQLLAAAEIVIGLRSQQTREHTRAIVEAWPVQPQAVTLFESYAPHVSSGKIREALRRHQKADGVLRSVERYSDHNWLYVSLTGQS